MSVNRKAKVGHSYRERRYFEADIRVWSWTGVERREDIPLGSIGHRFVPGPISFPSVVVRDQDLIHHLSAAEVNGEVCPVDYLVLVGVREITDRREWMDRCC
jgi:hypothetical protein